MKKKKIAILGGGETGVGSAILAIKHGYDVFVSSLDPIEDNYKQELTERNIPFEENEHSYNEILKSDFIIKSPGIPDSASVIKKIKESDLKIISEIEFAGYYSKAKHICITGSNGKTTTSLLAFHLLKNAGLNVGLAGNIGDSFARQVALNDYDYYILEISSFQLDNMYDFRADTAVLLNITPDHLDRYEGDMQKYADSKFRIIQNQRTADSFIFCADDKVIMKNLKGRESSASLFPVSINTTFEKGGFINDNKLIINTDKEHFEMELDELALHGKHNLYNSMAAGIIASLCEVRKKSIRESLRDFKNAEHRLEYVAAIQNISFINDSKATNVHAAWYALDSMTGRVVWIVGGRDKGNDYSMLKNLVKEKVKAIVCLGLDNTKIHRSFQDDIDVMVDAKSMNDAVNLAYNLAEKGDTVLLSPACSSFDLFKNYKHRGSEFKKSVKSL